MRRTFHSEIEIKNVEISKLIELLKRHYHRTGLSTKVGKDQIIIEPSFIEFLGMSTFSCTDFVEIILIKTKNGVSLTYSYKTGMYWIAVITTIIIGFAISFDVLTTYSKRFMAVLIILLVGLINFGVIAIRQRSEFLDVKYVLINFKG